MITVSRTAMTSRAKRLASLLFIVAEQCNQVALLKTVTCTKENRQFLLIEWCWLWQPSQMLNVLSQAIWHALLPQSRRVDAYSGVHPEISS